MVKRVVSEAHRRSARISALEERARVRQTKDLAGTSLSLPEASRKRGRKRKSLLSVVTNSLANLHGQGVINLINDDSAAQPHELEHGSSPQQMPTKQTLEFFLDILQRRDKYEIFAQPVNGEEVVGYYSIIKEPMDFGTMRAKLQEGMYTSLDQFERDVFLISSNAMKFNASNTVYYAEAQAISKMAQRLFHSLRTEPENFQLELTRTRRRPGRRALGQASYSSARATKSSFLNDFSLKRKALGPSHSNSHTGHKKNNASTSGLRDDRNCETDKRMTYMPQTICSENEKIVSAVLDAPKSLQLVNSAATHYTDSLMRFIDGLGPQVQTVARQKHPIEAPKSPWTPTFGFTPEPSAFQNSAFVDEGIGSLIPAAYKGKAVCNDEGDHSYRQENENAPTSLENMDLLIATLSQTSNLQSGHKGLLPNLQPQNISQESPYFTRLLNYPEPSSSSTSKAAPTSNIAASTRIPAQPNREGPNVIAPSQQGRYYAAKPTQLASGEWPHILDMSSSKSGRPPMGNGEGQRSPAPHLVHHSYLANTPLRMGLRSPNREELTLAAPYTPNANTFRPMGGWKLLNGEAKAFRPLQLMQQNRMALGTVSELNCVTNSTQADGWRQLGPTPWGLPPIPAWHNEQITPVQPQLHVPIINPINFLAGANSPEFRQDQINAQIFGNLQQSSENGNGLPDLDLQL